MTISPPVAVLGAQTPRIQVAPPSVTSAGAEAVELAEAVGLHLDPWQRHVLDVALGERADSKWSAFEVGLWVSRQNGKGSVLEALELANLFLFDAELILHSAHEFKTAQEAFRRVLFLVENSDHLRKRVARVRTSHGEEGIELTTGARLRFVARSTGSGRGFSGDLVILDEAYNLGAEQMAALLPVLSARPNPQIWYTSSAAMASSTQLHRVRQRALAGGDARLCYFEWSAEESDDPADPDVWAQANPALGIRIEPEFVASEMAAMPLEVFRRERLGIPDAAPIVSNEVIIPEGAWAACEDAASVAAGPLVFAVDVTPSREWSSVCAASLRPDGRVHVEVVARAKGVSWVPDWLAERVAVHKPLGVVLDPSGPAGTLVPDLAARKVDVVLTGARDMAQACGRFLDAVLEGRLAHIGQEPLSEAVAGARRRTLGDAWAWARRDTSVDLSPLVGVTLAAWKLAQPAPEPAPPPRVVSLSDL